ncbi:hypothetical protein MAUB1S_02996 [Mycolicibacterium aubagnense]
MQARTLRAIGRLPDAHTLARIATVLGYAR